MIYNTLGSQALHTNLRSFKGTQREARHKGKMGATYFCMESLDGS